MKLFKLNTAVFYHMNLLNHSISSLSLSLLYRLIGLVDFRIRFFLHKRRLWRKLYIQHPKKPTYSIQIHQTNAQPQPPDLYALWVC